MLTVIDKFDGDYAFLSNFYECSVVFFGEKYDSSEAAFQAMKCERQQDHQFFTSPCTPSESKKLGRHIKLRPDWEKVKYDYMFHIVLEKFMQHPALAQRLIETGDAILIEGNTWGDRIWGTTKDSNGKWIGENNLGKILMKVRDMLKGYEFDV